MNRNNENVSNIFVGVCALFVTCLLLSNVIAGKIANIANVTMPAAVVLFPVTYILGDVFTEVYGFRKARTIIWLGFACNLFAVIVYMITVALPYPDFWDDQEAYVKVLGITPRILIASLLGYAFGEFSNSVILSKLKVKMLGRKLWIRTMFSTVVGEALDTVVFIFISFWRIVTNETMLEMICSQYLWKVCYEIALTPVTYIVINYLKRIENTDVYDQNIKYHIFKFEKNNEVQNKRI